MTPESRAFWLEIAKLAVPVLIALATSGLAVLIHFLNRSADLKKEQLKRKLDLLERVTIEFISTQTEVHDLAMNIVQHRWLIWKLKSTEKADIEEGRVPFCEQLKANVRSFRRRFEGFDAQLCLVGAFDAGLRVSQHGRALEKLFETAVELDPSDAQWKSIGMEYVDAHSDAACEIRHFYHKLIGYKED